MRGGHGFFRSPLLHIDVRVRGLTAIDPSADFEDVGMLRQWRSPGSALLLAMPWLFYETHPPTRASEGVPGALAVWVLSCWTCSTHETLYVMKG